MNKLLQLPFNDVEEVGHFYSSLISRIVVSVVIFVVASEMRIDLRSTLFIHPSPSLSWDLQHCTGVLSWLCFISTCSYGFFLLLSEGCFFQESLPLARYTYNVQIQRTKCLLRNFTVFTGWNFECFFSFFVRALLRGTLRKVPFQVPKSC